MAQVKIFIEERSKSLLYLMVYNQYTTSQFYSVNIEPNRLVLILRMRIVCDRNLVIHLP